jgi:hypothetical protein
VWGAGGQQVGCTAEGGPVVPDVFVVQGGVGACAWVPGVRNKEGTTALNLTSAAGDHLRNRRPPAQTHI